MFERVVVLQQPFFGLLMLGSKTVLWMVDVDLRVTFVRCNMSGKWCTAQGVGFGLDLGWI